MTLGAYSIVVSSKYEDLDVDYGNILYYSGSDSHDNDNPDQPGPSSNGTKALTASWQNQNPVRVLRSGGSRVSNAGGNNHLPSCGIRYDGLYRVTAVLHKINGKGKLNIFISLSQCSSRYPYPSIQDLVMGPRYSSKTRH
jgi:hypothetical protein